MKIKDTKRFVYLPVHYPFIAIEHNKNTKESNNKNTKSKENAKEPSTTMENTKESNKEKKNNNNENGYISKISSRPAISSFSITQGPNYPVGPKVVLKYPKGEEEFMLSRPDNDYDPITDIYNTVILVAKLAITNELGNEKEGIVRNICRSVHKNNIPDLITAINEYNTLITKLEFNTDKANSDLARHIFEQSYSRSISPQAHLLNNYKGFSNNVYGEINYNFVEQIIVNSKLQAHHVFLDLGSGIGNVVLQVAGTVLCESYGIEIMQTPAMLAKKQRAEFLSRMRYYGKPCGRIYLKHGDFLQDTGILDIIAKADIIFVNNYAFDAELNQGILALLLDIKDSCKVITLKSFVPNQRAPSLRRINAIESIFEVKQYSFPRGSVSWMMEGGSYFIHTVDRSLVSGQTDNIK